MNIEELKQYTFYVQIGYITFLASVLTLIVTQIIKVVLKKKQIIYEGMEVSKQDMILSRVGRIVAFIMYAGLYIGNELLFKHAVKIDEPLLVGLISGTTLTLTVSKGIYTMLHQWSKKTKVYDELEDAKKVIEVLVNEEARKESPLLGKKTVVAKPKWILTNRKENNEE